MPSPFREQDAIDLPATTRGGGNGSSTQPSQPLTRHPSALSAYRPLLRGLTVATVLAFLWLLARMEIGQVRRCQSMSAGLEAMAHCQMAEALTLQHQTAQALAHYTEAVHLAERACELAGYKDPVQLGTLACIYAATGRFDQAFATARKGRDLALASGRVQLAEWLLTLMEDYNARKPVRGE